MRGADVPVAEFEALLAEPDSGTSSTTINWPDSALGSEYPGRLSARASFLLLLMTTPKIIPMAIASTTTIIIAATIKILDRFAAGGRFPPRLVSKRSSFHAQSAQSQNAAYGCCTHTQHFVPFTFADGRVFFW